MITKPTPSEKPFIAYSLNGEQAMTHTIFISIYAV